MDPIDGDGQFQCRLCASIKENKIGMNIFVVATEDETNQISKVLQKHFAFLNIMTDDGRSQMICNQCWTIVDQFNILYMLVISDIQNEKINGVINNKIENVKNVIEQTVDDVDAANDDDDVVTNPCIRSTKPTVNKSYYKDQDRLIECFFRLDCQLCNGLHFEKYSEFKLHSMQAHAQKAKLTCCGKTFSLRYKLIEHIGRHNNPKDFTCEQCGKMSADKSALKLHILNHTVTAMKPYKCKLCPSTFIKQGRLKQHELTHRSTTDQKIFECDSCGKKCLTKYLIKSHILLVHNKQSANICDICGKVFSTPYTLFNHTQLVHGEDGGRDVTKLQCSICAAWLKNKYCMQSHMKRHTDGSIACPLCSHVAPNRRALQMHRNFKHTDPKFKCQMCQKPFKTTKQMREHMATHTGEDLYSCLFCTKTFKCGSNRFKHYHRMHPGEYDEFRRTRQLAKGR